MALIPSLFGDRPLVTISARTRFRVHQCAAVFEQAQRAFSAEGFRKKARP